MALTAVDKALLLFIAKNAVLSTTAGLAPLITAVQNEPVDPPPTNPQPKAAQPS